MRTLTWWFGGEGQAIIPIVAGANNIDLVGILLALLGCFIKHIVNIVFEWFDFELTNKWAQAEQLCMCIAVWVIVFD